MFVNCMIDSGRVENEVKMGAEIRLAIFDGCKLRDQRRLNTEDGIGGKVTIVINKCVRNHRIETICADDEMHVGWPVGMTS